MSARSLAVAGIMVVFAVSAEAAVVVDQSSLLTATTGTNWVASSIVQRIQDPAFNRLQSMSVTAGKTGRLSQIDVQVQQLDGTGDLVLSIASGIVGQPGFATLGSFTVARSNVPTAAQSFAGSLVSVDVSSLAFDVAPGTVFSIMLGAGVQQIGNNRYAWVLGESADGSDGNTLQLAVYANGFNQLSDNGGATWSVSGVDRTFRTWVDTGVVPEPGSWAMLIAGFGLTGAVMRRRRIGAA